MNHSITFFLVKNTVTLTTCLVQKTREILKLATSLILFLFSTNAEAQNLITVIEDGEAALNSVQIQKLESMRSTGRYTSVQCIQIANISSVQENGLLAFTMPESNTPLVAEPYRIETYEEDEQDNFVWYAKFRISYEDENEEIHTDYDGRMIVRKEGEDYSGHIELPFSGNVFEIWSLGDGKNILASLDMDWPAQFECAMTTGEYTEDPGSPSTGCVPIVKVLVCYTQAAENAVANIDQLIDQIFIYQNAAVYNSAGSLQYLSFQLAAKQKVSFVEGQNGSTGGLKIRNDLVSIMGDVTIQALRNNNNADIVILLTDIVYPGIAGAAQNYKATKDEAYAIITAPNAVLRRTFMHELGHLMGGYHQQTQVCDGNPDDEPGFAHGYRVVTSLGDKKTIMTNTVGSCGSTGRELLYSTPNIQLIGQPMGTISGNNVTQELLNNACVFAGYYQEGGSSGGGLVVINGQQAALDYSNVNLTAITQGIPSPVSYSWAISYDGFGYYGAGGNSVSLSEYMNDEDHLWVKVTVMGGSMTASDFHKVKNLANPYVRKGAQQQEQSHGLAYKQDAHHLKLYPNPSKDELTLSFTSKIADKIEIAVYDLRGKIWLNNTFSVAAASINTQKLFVDILPGGCYFLTFKSSQHEIRQIFTVLP